MAHFDDREWQAGRHAAAGLLTRATANLRSRTHPCVARRGRPALAVDASGELDSYPFYRSCDAACGRFTRTTARRVGSGGRTFQPCPGGGEPRHGFRRSADPLRASSASAAQSRRGHGGRNAPGLAPCPPSGQPFPQPAGAHPLLLGDRPVQRLSATPRGGLPESLRACRPRDGPGFYVLVFPEGRRTPDGLMHRFQGGAGILWKKLGTRTLPVYRGGLGAPKARKGWFRPGRAWVHIGRPLLMDRALQAANATRVLEQGVRQLGPGILALIVDGWSS